MSQPCHLSTVLCAGQGKVLDGQMPPPSLCKVTLRPVSGKVALSSMGCALPTGLALACSPCEPWGCHPCCRLDDAAEAPRYHQESHRVYPVDMEVISWLGAFHVKNEVRSHLQQGRASAPHCKAALAWLHNKTGGLQVSTMCKTRT